ncbi:hypothetical protein QGN32_17245 [Mycolicibacterium sp. ND9-15]|uniref:hypothetical protein n=1 Tax=Mycolicibacterium sp. ND9-15 TaxID=3042320 RepID=UPI002DDA6399|nr:hypothetical protein [Mycolicibacterium sp. ND9-15]WSE55180.1 hypothetical protein QGN32_17245 [Mycolicibacterium sp. ND9-15]
MASDLALSAAGGDATIASEAAGLQASLAALPNVARLGACVGPLLELSESDAELDLLRRASALWQRGSSAADQLHTARVEFELSLARDDLPDALEVLDMGMQRLTGLHGVVKDLIADVSALQSEVTTLDHLPPHPRQADEPSMAWGWGNAFAGRRAFAFVAAVLAGAQDERGQAFAAGTLSGYAGHVAGSAFLGTVVGGPRRLHRFRDRLARNTLGVWLRRETSTPRSGELAGLLRLDGRDDPLQMPADLAVQLEAALADAYPSRPAADVQLGYRSMIEHLELLDSFALPLPPEPPPIVPAAGGGTGPIETQTFDQPQDGVDMTVGMGPETDHDSPGMSSQKKAQGDVCAYILLLIATVGLAYLIWCIGRLTDDKKCGIEDFVGAGSPDPPDPTAPTTQQKLEKLREPAAVNHILSDIYQLELRLWQAFAAARSFLTVCGLLAPDEQELSQPLYRQFLEVSPTGPWPGREPADAAHTYATRPTSAAEQPTTAVPYPDRGPAWLLHADLVDNESTISEVVIEALRAYVRADEQTNLDLDADRGRLHPAWSVRAGTSIADQPLDVEILNFGEE